MMKIKIKEITILIGFIWFQTHLLAQPGPPPPVNLNQYRGISHAVIIDSCTDLTKIEVLNKSNYPSSGLELYLYLSEIPAEFVGFTHIKSLHIICGNELKDLSGLNYFPNLERLVIEHFEGENLSKELLQLDSLQRIRIQQSRSMMDITALTSLANLQELDIYNCPSIAVFPKWINTKKLQRIKLHNGNGFEFWGKSNQKSNLDLTNLQFLEHLESINLGGYSCFSEIPACLPKSITTIQFSGNGYRNQWDKVELKNLENLKLYPNLKNVYLQGVCLEKIETNFKGLSLEQLSLSAIYNLSDISGLFTFKRIDNLKITECNYLEYIKSNNRKCNIGFLDLQEVSRLQNIYFLFKCKNIQKLEIRNASLSLFIPELKRMDNIPTILLYASGLGYHLYKKDNVWEMVELDTPQ